MKAFSGYRYLEITKEFQYPDQKTGRFRVYTNHADLLGIVKWHGPWRQYAFFPEPGTVWSAGCLSDIVDFLGKLKVRQRRTLGRAT